MRIAAVVQARMASTRLPGKVLAEAAGKPLLAHMVERLDQTVLLDDILLAVPWTAENAPLVRLARDLRIVAFRGPEDDVLSRVLDAAWQARADVIVEVTGDCPLVDPKIVDQTIGYFLANHVDFAWSVPAEGYGTGYPRGMDVRVFRTKDLERVSLRTEDPADREHVSLYFWEHPEEFRIGAVKPQRGLVDDVRLTVDTPEDLQLVRAIFESLYPANPEFGLSEILALLAARPDLREINRHVKQKATR